MTDFQHDIQAALDIKNRTPYNKLANLLNTANRSGLITVKQLEELDLNLHQLSLGNNTPIDFVPRCSQASYDSAEQETKKLNAVDSLLYVRLKDKVEEVKKTLHNAQEDYILLNTSSWNLDIEVKELIFADLSLAKNLLSNSGLVVEVSESNQDAVTALSGSGPAYFFSFVEAMINAGVKLGLTNEIATQLAIGTISGSAAMLKESGLDATTLRKNVTSPNGTTAAALSVFTDKDLEKIVLDAMTAAKKRAQELA